MHIRKLFHNGTRKVNELHEVTSNMNFNLRAHRLLLTLGAHACSEGYYSCRVCMYVCV